MENELDGNYTEKGMIVSELLGIRGGLSLISKYTDEIREQERLIEEERTKVHTAESRYERSKEEVANVSRQWGEQERRCRYLKEDIQYANEVATGKRKPCEESNVRFFFWYGGELGAIIGLVIVTFLVNAALTAVIDVPDSFYGFFVYAMPLILPVVIMAVIWSVIFYVRKVLEYAAWIRKAQREYQQLKSKLEQEERVLESLFQKGKKAEQDMQYACQAASEQQDRANIAIGEYKKQISMITEQSRLVNKALQQTYGVFLNEADWGNVDLILHYIETGRADTLKEALYQVDRQRQNDRLVSAIRDAQAAICNHIESAFLRMGEALAQSFARLDDSLQDISKQLIENRQNALSAQASLMKKLDTQISATQMNNVLLEKANKTSDDLLHDLRYNQKYWIK